MRILASICALCVLAVDDARPQAVKVERFAYARMQQLRAQLLQDVLVADPATRAAVAERLAAPPSGNPFADVAEALAIARGIEIDDAFRVRAGLLVMALPEVVDPDERSELHVTVHAPRIVPEVGPSVFEVELRDVEGRVVRRATIEEKTEVEDLLRYRATTALDVSDLLDGRYRVSVRTRIGGETASRGDVELGAPVAVLRGFKARADALPIVVDGAPERMENARRVVESIPAALRGRDDHAMLTGAVWQVARAYAGEPWTHGADAVVDLARAEYVLAGLRVGRPARHAIFGIDTTRSPTMTVGFPLSSDDEVQDVGTAVVPVLAAGARDPLPLVVVVPAAPSWDHTATRPLSPRSVGPGWALRQLELGGLSLGGSRFLVAALESPGRFPSAPRAVLDAVGFLKRILPVRDDAVVLVGEREGAYAVSRAAVLEPGLACGIALVAGGALSLPDLEKLGDTRVLVAPAHGHPSSLALAWLAQQGRSNVTALPADGVGWSTALGQHASAIQAFVERTAEVAADERR